MSDETKITPDAPSEPPSLAFAPKELEPFRDTGYELIPLQGKAPFKRNWLSEKPLGIVAAQERLAEKAGNVGVRLRPCDLVLDFDPARYEGTDRLEQIQRELKIDLAEWPHVVTGSGGHHFYMTVPDDFLAVGKVPGYPGVDVKAFGGQVVAPGSVHPTTGRAYRWAEGSAEPWEEVPAPTVILDLVRRAPRQTPSAAGKYEPEQLADMLEWLYPEDFRDHTAWLELMMSCHYATAGAGRDEFVAWSIGDPEYAKDELLIGRRWDSLHADDDDGRPKVTEKLLGRLWLEAQQGAEGALKDFADEPEASGAVEAAEAIQKDRSERQKDLARDWVYLVRQEAYLRRSDCSQWSQQQFRMMHQSAWKLSENIHEAIIKDKLAGFRKVESPVYEPGKPEFLPDGNYNIWRDTGVRPDRDDDLAQAFLDHLAYLFPDGEQGELLLDWLHYIAADVPVKVNFAPLVFGAVQGAGKTYISEVMVRMLGKPNVGVAESDDLKKEFNGNWAENRQLAVIEELMDVGRLEIGNRLKTVITNSDLRIRRMYRDPYTVPNRLNLLAFTNHPDALRLENRDRRWLILSTPVEPKEDAYYARLFELLDDDRYIAAVRYMLQQRRPRFSAKGSAPMTAAKLNMTDLARDEVEQYLSERLGERLPPFDFDLVRLDDVFGQAKAEFGNQPKLRSKVTKWLQSTGAVSHARYTNSDRPSYTLWSVRDHERWKAASAAERIDAWTAQYGQEA